MISFIYFILFIIFLYKWYYNATSKARKSLPPSPAKLPVIGNLLQLGLHPHRSLKGLSERYGPLMMLHLGSVPALIVSSADAVREIVKNQDLIFSSRPKLSVMHRIVYGSKDIAFARYGDHWRQVRSIGVLQLLSNKRVQSYRHIREEETSLMIEKIRNSPSSSMSEVNLSNLLVSLTNSIISRVVLGRKYDGGEESENFELMLKEIGELLVTFNPGDYVPWLNWINRVSGFDARLEKVAKSFDEFLTRVVEEHRSRKQGKTDRDGSSDEVDFVDILLEIQRENSSSYPIETDTIKALIFDMFGAGTDTTFTALEWTMAELLRHPKIMEKLQNEVRLVAGSKLDITEEDLEKNKMPYLKAVIKESLRLHPPFPLLLPRELTQDTTLMGYEVAAGTRVMINAWAIGRDPILWKNPEEFHPERFLDSGIDFKGFDFEFIPFGVGRRGCPGITFAIGVDELALAKLMHKFNFATQKDLDMTEAPGHSVHVKFPLLVNPIPHFASN
ncbi:cytochrome P450 71A6-like [Olea europaea subsp. europaea]|uniref:Cytochrome P450 71A6-like n=1 Tax=Olea europaea subsp. europaea TaxID=158383 RepID=A0A8S0RTP6_OLEEU|nr:cytochrome P450 71A6-like [Olea europaea subsp. europaea]